ncbi:MAG TPA: hypothetical protein VFX60_07615 [Micromonospora sp.]|nr:hypothetical protein [Micromonospora sp.]
MITPRAPASSTAAEPVLRGALNRLRTALTAATYPLLLPSTDEARRTSAALLRQLDDYLLPRLARPDTPLLVVVGGSTGVGKSTLVNSLVQARVSAPGILRPTTRSPVLVCHPRDLSWFRAGNLLPGLTRTSRSGDTPGTLQLVSAPALPPGLAFLDAPDIDSIIDANRALATQLLAAADLWLFVTTPARYADAVPWELLRTARLRGAALALVLDRVSDRDRDELVAHLKEMLAAADLAATPLFVVPETKVDGQGLLPEHGTAQLRDWFGRMAADPESRARVIRQTFDGALAALLPVLTGLAAAADEQAEAAKMLNERVRAAYRIAYDTVLQGLPDGDLLPDESDLVALISDAAADAAERAYAGWRTHPAGLALLEPALARLGPDLPERAERLVRDWRSGTKAQADLVDGIEALMAEEATRYLCRVATPDPATTTGSGHGLGDELRHTAAEIEQARVRAARTDSPPERPTDD